MVCSVPREGETEVRFETKRDEDGRPVGSTAKTPSKWPNNPKNPQTRIKESFEHEPALEGQ